MQAAPVFTSIGAIALAMSIGMFFGEVPAPYQHQTLTGMVTALVAALIIHHGFKCCEEDRD